MTSEEYEASSMGTDGTARSVLVQTWECGLCEVDYIPTTAVQRVSGLCASCVSTLYGEDAYQEYGSVATSYESLVQAEGDDPDYLYQQFDDIHSVPVERAEDTDLSRAVTRLLEPEDLAASYGGRDHRNQCFYCEGRDYGAPGCPGVSA